MSLSSEDRQRLEKLEALLRDGRASEAKDPLRKLAYERLDPRSLQILGECYLAMGLTREAIVPLAAATGLTDHAAPATLLASTLLKIGRSQEALLAAQRVLRRDPRNREALRIMQQVPRG